MLYLNPEGLIPDVCVIKKGEKRSKPFQEVEKPKGEGADAPSPAGDEDDDYTTADKSRLVEMEG